MKNRRNHRTGLYTGHDDNNGNRQMTWLAWLGTLCCGLLLSVSSADAQQWKYVYGVDSTSDRGENRVVPVLGACTSPQNGGVKGYIAVGTTTVEGVSHVYVVRTNNNGSRAWEKVYDIQDDDDQDEGWGIVELSDGTGFALTGTTFNENRKEDLFIMKIDCSGTVVWTETYGTEYEEFGYDIIEAQTGDPTVNPPTNSGDLVVAGWASYLDASSNHYLDAYMLRVTSAGVLIWNKVYDTAPNMPGADYIGQFHALTEATPVGTAATGDLIGVGWVQEGAPHYQQGLVIRIDGNTGTTGNTTRQRGGHFGGSVKWDCDPLDTDDHYGEETFFSVIETSDTNEVDMSGVPNVIVVGYSTAPGKEEIYAVSLRGGDPCVVAQERLIGDALYGDDCGNNEIARCVREVDWEMTGSSVSRWDLALTGYTDRVNPANGDFDAFLLTIDPGTLLPPTGGIQKTYGQSSSSSGSDEIGNSLHPVDAVAGRTEGFIICGSNRADPMGVSDNEDMYLIKTNSAGAASSTGECEGNPDFRNNSVDWDSCVTPKSSTHGNDTTVTTTAVTPDTDDEICTGAPKPSIETRRDRETEGATLSFRFSPNPVEAGAEIEIRDLHIGAGNAVLRVYNAAGELVAKREINSDARSMALATEGFSAGVYTFVVEDDVAVATTRFVVTR